MIRNLIIVMCVVAWFGMPEARADSASDEEAQSESPEELDPNLVAGMPYEEAQTIVARHREALMKVPGVYGVGTGSAGILVAVYVHTDAQGRKPADLPAPLQALPAELEGLPLTIHPVYVLPPPPGVIVLRPDGSREQASECPDGYREETDHTWRFCVLPTRKGPLPPMMAPPVAGVPYEDAQKIVERHQDELMALPGVSSVGLGKEGIYIEIKGPSILPQEVEGLPFEIHPYGSLRIPDGHTFATEVRPTHAGIAVGAPSPFGGGTLTAAAFNGGMWLVFPAHLFSNKCANPSPCTEPKLRSCVHRYTGDFLKQPPISGPTVGRIVKWTPLVPFTNVHDVAAAWLDNDATQGNASICVDELLESAGDWTGQEGTVMVGNTVKIVTANNPHIIMARINAVNVSANNVLVDACTGNPFNSTATYINQVRYSSMNRPFMGGDSGAIILTTANRIVGLHLFSEAPTRIPGGGTLASFIRSTLGFSDWYGTNTFPNKPVLCQ